MSNHTETTTVYTMGANMPGYLPEMDIDDYETFDEAKRALIDMMLRDADQFCDEDDAERVTLAAEDVNLWSGPCTTVVGDSNGNTYAYWVASRVLP